MHKKCEVHKRFKNRNDEEKDKYIKRLNRIEGQIRGINRMVEDNRHCDDILIQVSASISALKSLAQEMLENHMKTCMIEDINNRKYESIDEIIDLFRKLI